MGKHLYDFFGEPGRSLQYYLFVGLVQDKWKTLVHTASISPQQRRGEPVPQELLDRVLAAHAYWSQHQAKQQGKNQPGTLKLEAQADRIGVPGM